MPRKVSRWVPGFAITALERFIRQRELNEILRNGKGLQGSAFAESALEYLDIDVEVSGLDSIPEGRYMFASNHPLGGLDGIALIKILGKKYGDDCVRFLVNDMLMNVEPLSNVFLPINKYGSQGRKAAMAINEAMASHWQVLQFPAGLVSLYMPEKPQAKAFPFARPLNDAGDVGHDKRLVAAIIDDTERRLHSGERIVAYLRFRSRYGREKSRFSRIWETDKPHVSKQFQFEHYTFFYRRLPRLRIAGRTVGRRGKMPVAEPAFAPAKKFHLFAVFRNLTKESAGLGIKYGRADRHVDDPVFAILSGGTVGTSGLSVGGEYMTLVAQWQQSPHMTVASQDYVSAPAAVAAVGASFGNILRPMEMSAPRAPFSGATKNLDVVYKIRFCHIVDCSFLLAM